MFNIKKAGMLIVLLAFPAFFFLFLKTCGTNHYDLPYFHPLPDSVVRDASGRADTAYYEVSGVLGITPDGDTVTSGVLSERITAFYPGGSNPEKEEQLSEVRNRLLEILAKEKDFQLLERTGSRPGEVRAGVIKVNAGPDSTSSWETILKTNENNGSSGTLYENSSLVLVDGKRHIRGYYDLLEADDFDRAVAEIKILLYQKKIAGK